MQLTTLPKGTVERAIRFVRERFLAGRSIVSVEQGNRELRAFIDEIAHPRRHPTLPERTVIDCLDEERARLLALPPAPFSTDVVLSVSVDKTAFVRFDTNSYSVPSKFAGGVLTLVADDAVVRLLDGGTEVARHVRSYKRKDVVEAPEHRDELLEQKRRARDARGRDRLRALVPAVEALFEHWVQDGKNLAIMTMRTTKLLELYGDEVFKAARQGRGRARNPRPKRARRPVRAEAQQAGAARARRHRARRAHQRPRCRPSRPGELRCTATT